MLLHKILYIPLYVRESAILQRLRDTVERTISSRSVVSLVRVTCETAASRDALSDVARQQKNQQ